MQNLRSNRLRSLPPEIAYLSPLRVLNLADNQLTELSAGQINTLLL